MQNRLSHIDWLRAFGIFLVVYGHSLAVPDVVLKGIYVFHIPLFFFLSGFVLTKEKAQQSFFRFVRTIGGALLPAYFIFAAIGYLAWLLILRKFGSDSSVVIPLTQPLWAIFYGSGTADDMLQPLVLWFFPALFTTQILLWSLLRIPKPYRIIAAAAGIAGGMYLKQMALPFEFESALLALPFIWLGHELAQATAIRVTLERVPVLVALIAFATAVWLGEINDFTDLRTSQYGNPALFYLSALLAITSLYALAVRLPEHPGIKRVSRATLVIFPLHPLAFAALAAIYTFVLRLPLAVREQPWIGLIASATIVIVLTLVAPSWQKAMGAIRLAAPRSMRETDEEKIR